MSFVTNNMYLKKSQNVSPEPSSKPVSDLQVGK